MKRVRIVENVVRAGSNPALPHGLRRAALSGGRAAEVDGPPETRP